MARFDDALLEYDVTIRQQPLHARISAMKVSDRRPVDPPIIVQLAVRDHRDTGSPTSRGSAHQKPSRHSHLTNPYYFMYAALVDATTDTEVKFVSDGRPSTSGALVSSIRVLKDHPNSDKDAAFFIFSDICVRLEGSWRFKLSLFVIDSDRVKSCATIYSAPFFVYQGKQYPGVQVSTPLTRGLAAQGVKLRIRKEIREKTAGMRSKDDLHTPEAQEISAAQTIPTANVDTHFSKSPSPKRRRTLPNPIGAGAIFSADSTSTADTFDGQRTPLQQLSPPAPPSFYSVPSNMQQCDPRLRRASLDAQAFQRPYPTRDWLPPRAPDGYQPTQSPSFTVPATIQPKPEPDFSQWALLRPAHPSPEATHPHAVGGQYDQPELFTRRLPVPSPDKDRYTAAASPMYSWTPASGLGRDIFSSSSATPENPQPQLSQTPTPVFWGMSSNSVPRAQFEQQQQASTPQSGWANAADRYVYDGQTHYSMTR